ncbi:DUF2510 domain-containing protein [Rhodococcus zopfii]
MNPPAGWHPDPYDSNIERFWDGQQWTAQTRPRGSDDPTTVFPQYSSVEPQNSAPGQTDRKRPKWLWIGGAAAVVLLGAGAVAQGSTKQEDPPPVVATSTTAAPTTTTSRTTTTSTTTTPPAPSTETVEQVPTTTHTYVQPTTTYVAPPAPTTTTSANLEYSCSDATWRESMGAEGDELCGAPWTPRTQPARTTQPTYTTESSSDTVHPGSYCSRPGATGYTTKGTLMVCGPGSDGKDRWQSAN